MLSHNGTMEKIPHDEYFVEFTRWRHWGEVAFYDRRLADVVVTFRWDPNPPTEKDASPSAGVLDFKSFA